MKHVLHASSRACSCSERRQRDALSPLERAAVLESNGEDLVLDWDPLAGSFVQRREGDQGDLQGHHPMTPVPATPAASLRNWSGLSHRFEHGFVEAGICGELEERHANDLPFDESLVRALPAKHWQRGLI
jgi:hypothetical protein